MTRARDISNDQANLGGAVAPFVAGKNALINGGFDIWQRGTSGFGPNVYNADRWYMTQSGGTSTISQESTIVPAGSKYSLKIAQTVASGNVYVTQAIETANAVAFAGKTVSFSIQAGASASTAVSLLVGYSTGTDTAVNGSYTNIAASTGGTGTVTSTTFAAISGTYAIPSTAKTLQITIQFAPASGTSCYLGQAQLELGSVATTFSRNGTTLQGELAACQRYYEKSYALATAPGTATTANEIYGGYLASASSAFTTGYILSSLNFKVPKRVTPSITVYDESGAANFVTANIPGVGIVNGNSPYIVAGETYTLVARDGSAGTRTNCSGFSYHYTANAEL